MRKILIAISIIFIATNLSAMEIKERVITVVGTSEMLVVPDEIEIEITLEEQGGNNNLSKIEQMLWEKLVGQEIGKKQIVLNNINVMYYWYYWWKSRNASKKSKKIVIKLDSKTDFMKLVKNLNHDWVTDIKIIGVYNKNIEQHIKEVQSKAMRSAKEKAQYLLESIDEEIGKVVSVVELETSQLHSNNMHVESSDKNYSYSYRKTASGGYESIPEIRLFYSVKTKFEIK